MKKCDWCGDDPLYVAYHDKEWGSPLRNEAAMFEFLLLEGGTQLDHHTQKAPGLPLGV